MLGFWSILGLMVLLILVQLICNIIGKIVEGALLKQQRKSLVDTTVSSIYRGGLDLLLKYKGLREQGVNFKDGKM